MLRRHFLALGASATLSLAQQQQKQEDAIIATATQDTTPRVSIVLSSFKEGEDHDGTKLAGLTDPQPPGADLTDVQLDAMVRKAIDLGSLRSGDLSTVIEAEDWIVIKAHIPTCYGLGPETKDGGAHQAHVKGSVTDPRIVRSVISFLVENKRGMRFTIVEGSSQWLPMERSKSPVDGWSTDWGGEFGGLTYRKLVQELSAKYPDIRFEIADLNFAESQESPVPGKGVAGKNPSGAYTIPKVIKQCDRLISIAPLKTDASTGVSLSVKNYMGIAPGSVYGFPKDKLLALGSPDEVMIDLLAYRPADFALVGGSWGVEGDGASVHYNVMIAGMKAVCVDAVAAAVMGFNAADLPFLALGDKKGFGDSDPDIIWMRGNDLDQAKREFKKASGWAPKKPA